MSGRPYLDQLDPARPFFARPFFDATLLGLGPDGHAASLFPGTAVLGECHKWVAAVLDGKLEPRITLTYPLLEKQPNGGLPCRRSGKARDFGPVAPGRS
jgi:hypothetical protein